MLVGWVLISLLGKVWQTKMDDWTYGNPRTYQTDQDVGHDGRVSHFICLNLNGEIEVIEMQKGHPEASKIYIVTVLPADQASVPATIGFQDINGDGKIDALVHYANTEIPLYNMGNCRDRLESHPLKRLSVQKGRSIHNGRRPLKSG
jgi:hypothetical protein